MGKECGAWVSRRLWGGGNTSPLKTTAWEANKHRETFAAKQNLSDEKFLLRPLQETSTRLKKLELCCDVKRKKLLVQTCCP